MKTCEFYLFIIYFYLNIHVYILKHTMQFFKSLLNAISQKTYHKTLKEKQKEKQKKQTYWSQGF